MQFTSISQVSLEERDQMLRNQKDAILKKRKQQLQSSFIGNMNPITSTTNLLSNKNVVPTVKTFKISSRQPFGNDEQTCKAQRSSQRRNHCEAKKVYLKRDVNRIAIPDEVLHFKDDERQYVDILEQSSSDSSSPRMRTNKSISSEEAKTSSSISHTTMKNKPPLPQLSNRRILDSEIDDKVSLDDDSNVTKTKMINDETDTKERNPEDKLDSNHSWTSVDWNDKEQVKNILLSPCPKHAGIVKCYIRRNKGKAKLFPEYRVYLQDGDIFLMTSKKRAKKQSSNYLISIGRNDFNKHSDNIVGKLRANFLGSEFQIFDNGTNPKHVDRFFDEKEKNDPRSELGAILYSSNIMGNRGPRKMQVCINKIGNDGKSTKVWQPVHRDEEMIQSFKYKSESALRHLHMYENRQPKWNEDMGSYVLNFNNRVNLASVKNFQLIDPDDNNDNAVLQFGKASDEDFILDVQWPMSLFQAFAIALSSFDSKLACD